MAVVPTGKFVVHAAIRLRSQPSARAWVVDHLLAKRRFRTDTRGALVIAASATPAVEQEVVETVAALLGADTEMLPALRAIHRQFRAAGILVPPIDAGHVHAGRLVEQWTRRGWREAAFHHIATWDYPFLYYDEVGRGRQLDRERMLEYLAADPRQERTKAYGPEARSNIPLPPVRAALSTSDFGSVLRRQTPVEAVTFAALARAMSGAFGQTGTIHRTNIRRTSPSGGARHPTEAYLIALAVPSLRTGIYHFSTADCRLEDLASSEAVDARRMADIFFGLARAPFDVRAIVVLASRFERNQYRYREPRTFRTVFMDAGHLVESFGLVARSEGMDTFFHTGIDDLAAERLLGLEGLVEGVIGAIAVGSRA